MTTTQQEIYNLLEAAHYGDAAASVLARNRIDELARSGDIYFDMDLLVYRTTDDRREAFDLEELSAWKDRMAQLRTQQPSRLDSVEIDPTASKSDTPADLKVKVSRNWFVWSFEEGFEYYETETAAIHGARDKIAAACVDNEWDDNVEEIKVGCMTRETEMVDRVETENGYTCNYHLAAFKNS